MAYAPVTDDQEGAEEIVINNIDKDSYPTITLSNNPFQKLRDDPGPINYFLCGYKAVCVHDLELRAMVTKPVGMKILIDSNVPPAAGLSSSSAFTVCSAITCAHANGILNKIPQS